VYRRHEQPLVLQLCRLVRGFTHPGTYFNAEMREAMGAGVREGGGDVNLALYSVEEFSTEMVSIFA
ncbi:unnamed protein product, partial [Choristocarpus tenellus]